ncbi:hypothetical protein LDENG_00198480, partial [Lucifuga dentata]
SLFISLLLKTIANLYIYGVYIAFSLTAHQDLPHVHVQNNDALCKQIWRTCCIRILMCVYILVCDNRLHYSRYSPTPRLADKNLIKGPYHPFCMFEPNIFNFHTRY